MGSKIRRHPKELSLRLLTSSYPHPARATGVSKAVLQNPVRTYRYKHHFPWIQETRLSNNLGVAPAVNIAMCGESPITRRREADANRGTRFSSSFCGQQRSPVNSSHAALERHPEHRTTQKGRSICTPSLKHQLLKTDCYMEEVAGG